jgi:hypothetical protein
MAAIADSLETERRELRNGIVASLLVHLVLFLFLGFWMNGYAELEATRTLAAQAAARKKEAPKVALIFPTQILKESPQLKPKLLNKTFMDTSTAPEAEKPPVKAEFQSGRNTRAKSRLAPAPDGQAPLPTLRGNDQPTMSLSNQDAKAGAEKQGQPSLAQLPMKEPSAVPQLSKQYNTTSMIEDLERKAATQLAKLPLEVQKAEPATNEPQLALKELQMLPPEEGFVPTMRTAASKGTVAERGPMDSVDSESTALGRYHAALKTALQKKWEELVAQNNQRSIANSLVSIVFFIARDGSVVEHDVLQAKGSTEAVDNNKDLALKAIYVSKLPKPPVDVPQDSLGRVRVTFDFLPVQ